MPRTGALDGPVASSGGVTPREARELPAPASALSRRRRFACWPPGQPRSAPNSLPSEAARSWTPCGETISTAVDQSVSAPPSPVDPEPELPLAPEARARRREGERRQGREVAEDDVRQGGGVDGPPRGGRPTRRVGSDFPDGRGNPPADGRLGEELERIPEARLDAAPLRWATVHGDEQRCVGGRRHGELSCFRDVRARGLRARGSVRQRQTRRSTSRCPRPARRTRACGRSHRAGTSRAPSSRRR